MMLEHTQKIREIAGNLLRDGKVDVFVGYRKGSVPLTNTPVLIRDPEKVDQLIWDGNCALNLCNFLTKRTEKIGVVLNGCNSRNVVTHIIENQINRDQLYIIGIPCSGMIDERSVEKHAGTKEILDFDDMGETFLIKGNGFEETLNRSDFLQTNCSACTHRNPVLYDELIGDPVQELVVTEPFQDIKQIEALDSVEKQHFFVNLVSKCIRCYACRNACPLCYCPTCFVDESRPQWVGKSIDPTDTMTFHFLRAYHCAGRCTDCGACERACPMGIAVRQFTRKLNKDVLELFSWEAGLSMDKRPPLDAYRPDDNNDFIK